MIHRLAKLAAVFLLLGLVATWAVAWVGPRFDSPRSLGIVTMASDRENPYVLYNRRVSIVAERVELSGATWSNLNGVIADDERVPLGLVFGSLCWPAISHAEPAPRVVAIETVGWPIRSARFDVIADVTAFKPLDVRRFTITWESFEVRGGVALSGERSIKIDALAFSPIWPGLIANTLFYAAVFLGLHQLVGVTRRWRRRRRGRCAGCGYDLSGIEGECPKCGAAPRQEPATPPVD